MRMQHTELKYQQTLKNIIWWRHRYYHSKEFNNSFAMHHRMIMVSAMLINGNQTKLSWKQNVLLPPVFVEKHHPLSLRCIWGLDKKETKGKAVFPELFGNDDPHSYTSLLPMLWIRWCTKLIHTHLNGAVLAGLTFKVVWPGNQM